MSDPFLQALADAAAATTTKAATNAANDARQTNTKDDVMMEDTTSAIVDSVVPAPSAQRGIAFLQTHVRNYQQRIEDVLSYLEECRFGRPTQATAHIQRLQKTAQEMQADVRSLESEWATWLLLIELRRSDETIRDTAVAPSASERYSAQLLSDRLASAPAGALGRVLRILNWLEELQVYLLRIEETGSVSMRSTLRRLQRATAGDAEQDWIDPDVELRLKAAGRLPLNGSLIEKQDAEEEQRLLEYVWQLIRAGRLTDAIQLCRTYQQHWRAASLQGGERWHDEGVLQQDGTVFRVGNPNYLLWRYTCRKLSQAAGVSSVESSIYGLLGGDLSTALRFSGQHKYDDALYCHLRVLVDEQVDDFIRAEGKQEDTASRLPKTEATQNPYIRLQRWLMVDDTDAAEQEMVRTIRTQYRGPTSGAPATTQEAVNHTYLHFAVHLYLYLHPRCPHQEPLNATGVFLVQTYLAYLESNPMHHALVASYAQYLDSVHRVQFYIRFLKRIPSLPARQQLLQDLARFNPENSLEITTGLVQNIIGEEVAEKPTTMLQITDATATAAAAATTGKDAEGALGTASSTVPNLLSSPGSNVVTTSDLEKIVSVDCFALTGAHVELAVVQEALIQATQLYRAFIARDKYAAAKRFAQHLTDKAWEHHIFAIVQQQQQKKDTLPPLWYSLDREYGHWRLYIKCLNWYDTWLTQHGTQPKRPTFHPSHFQNATHAKAEYHQFAQKYERYAKEMDNWKKEQSATVRSCVSSFMELLECDGGWLQPGEGALRVEELRDLRQLCIPRLVAMVMQVCKEGNQQHMCLPVADVLASPTHSLHTCFTPEQLRSLLQQFRAAYIEVHLQQRDESEVAVE